MAAKNLHPLEVVVAVPVAPTVALHDLEKMEVKVIVLEPPEDFRHSVGAHYIEFPQVKDDEVIRLLHAR